MLKGFDRSALRTARFLIGGAGALGGHVAYGLVHQGASVTVVDPDRVEISNLDRQPFGPGDLGEYKAVALIRKLQREAPGQQRLSARVGPVEEYLEGCRRAEFAWPSVAGIFIDRPQSVFHAAYLTRHLMRPAPPVVWGLISVDSDSGLLVVQEDGESPCIQCINRWSRDKKARGCPVGSTIEMPMAIAGEALYAMHSVLMGRPRLWNVRRFSLSGEVPAEDHWAEPWDDCPICTGTWTF